MLEGQKLSGHYSVHVFPDRLSDAKIVQRPTAHNIAMMTFNFSARSKASLLLVLSLAFPALVGYAQTTWVGTTGDYNNGANWNNGAPAGGTTAIVPNGTALNYSVLTLSPGETGSFENLTLGTYDQFILTAGSNANTYLNLYNSGTLDGNGTLTLAYNGSGAGVSYIEQAAGGVTLTNKSTIDGAGVIGNGGLALDRKSVV